MVHYAFNHEIAQFDLANNYVPSYGSAEDTFGMIMKKSILLSQDEPRLCRLYNATNSLKVSVAIQHVRKEVAALDKFVQDVDHHEARLVRMSVDIFLGFL